MVGKRSHKARKRAQREARRQTRRARLGTRLGTTSAGPDADPRQTHVGYIAYDDEGLFCYRGDCLVASSLEEIQRTAHVLRPGSKANFVSASFGELIQAMEEQITFCFDDAAYRRFTQSARRCGMPIDKASPCGLDPRIVDAPGMVLFNLAFWS